MIFYLHYILLTSGLSGASVLLGVFFKTYSDASQGEIGILLMSFPFVTLVARPFFCSMADRYQGHQLYLILALTLMLLGYAPFVIVPFCQEFYTETPRLSWYLLIVASHIGSGALNVAWSLGDCLAVNAAQRKGIPFSRMRLMGTISWGLYGYVIGQINEVPCVPKFVPAFLILNLSVLVEIILLLCWNKEDFKMIDSTPELACVELPPDDDVACELPNTIKGGLAISESKSCVMTLELSQSNKLNTPNAILGCLSKLEPIEKTTQSASRKQQLSEVVDCKNKCNSQRSQLVIFKLILSTDGRLIKYLCLFIMFGILVAPMNFVFLSLDDVCKTEGCNFSQLAGAVLISQASIETICFFLLPWFMSRISRSKLLAFTMVILSARYLFYANYFYTADISPYWALLSEWGHGISYGIFITIMADVALMFANQSRFFIPEMRRLGFLSELNHDNQAKVNAEEFAIKMALRATMQGVFSALMEGLGQGLGSLVCGLIADTFSYIDLWHLFALISVGTLVVQQIVELTRSKWSDSYVPLKGTKASQILAMNVRNEQSQADSDKL